MFSLRLFGRTLPVIICALFMLNGPAAAQDQAGAPSPQQFAAAYAQTCMGAWTGQDCLSLISTSNLLLAADFMNRLNAAEQSVAANTVRETCAAATAAREGQFPANAMTSAFVECANSLFTISDETGIDPDQSRYQLLIGPIFCLQDAQSENCQALETQLQTYVQ